jgi:hypothetical protein
MRELKDYYKIIDGELHVNQGDEPIDETWIEYTFDGEGRSPLDSTMSEEAKTLFKNPSAASLMLQVRKERNQKLADTEENGAGLPDRPFSQAELDYRQALRDLPATTNPSLNSDLIMVGVTWPTKP